MKYILHIWWVHAICEFTINAIELLEDIGSDNIIYITCSNLVMSRSINSSSIKDVPTAPNVNKYSYLRFCRYCSFNVKELQKDKIVQYNILHTERTTSFVLPFCKYHTMFN